MSVMGKRLSGCVCASVSCLSMAALGCSDAVTMVRETPTGGVVSYSYKEDRGGHLMSPYRREADALMVRKCPTGYRIVREGEARGYSSISGIREGTEDEGIGRKWGIQFECKSGSRATREGTETQSSERERRAPDSQLTNQGGSQ